MDANLAQLRKLTANLKRNLRYPNSGGCCVIAVEIANHLQKIYPTKIRISTEYDDVNDTTVPVAASNISDPADGFEWNDNGIYFGHVVVEFKYKGRNYHMDTGGVSRATGCDPTFGWPFYVGDMTIAHARILARQDEGVWNSTFDRRQIPKMRKLVTEFFKTAQLTLT